MLGDEETFIQLGDILEIFYNDSDMNRDQTMVRGSDFCEMLGLFYDLTDQIRSYFLPQVDEKNNLYLQLEKLKAEH